jgi:hypothetical protein
MKFSMPFVCKSPINSGGMHWSTRAKLKDQCGGYVFAGIGKELNPVGKRRIIITIFRPSHHAMDRDNAYASVKPLVDAIKRLGHLRDDSEEWLDLQVVQMDAKSRRTEVEILEANNEF